MSSQAPHSVSSKIDGLSSFKPIMQFWAFLPKNITLKPASNFLHNSLAVLVTHSQAQKCLQSDPKPFQQPSMEFKKISI